MTTLTITRGLPASGKTTRALAWVTEDPTRRARVNRDDLGRMLHAGRLHTGPTEKRITTIAHSAVLKLLCAGTDVVCDDTNLPARVARELRALAVKADADFAVWDMTDVPLATCLERDALRTGPEHVGVDVITGMHTRYLHGAKYPLPLPDEPAAALTVAAPYVPLPGTPTAVMVDIDGTVATMCGRSPYDETLVGEDLPNVAVITAVRAMHAAGHAVVFCSGRTDGCREATEKWLAEHIAIPYEALFMRRAGDQRKDSVVKTEIFTQHIRDRYTVICVFDDRDQVVRAWRELGLTVMQVAEGNF